MSNNSQPKQSLGILTLTALGIVYGDIGTSPLYAFREAFAHGMEPTEANILATLSALFWAITLIISIKYIWLVLRFDNKGEGGVLALQALAQRHSRRPFPKLTQTILILGMVAAALFYGDAILTPAISVLSAVEGISVATPQFEEWILPIALGILIGLFLIQRYGTAKVGKLFGPITLVWFVTLAALGIISILQTPAVLKALNPLYALQFTLDHPLAAFTLLSAIFLALTGGEALYADMGHFGAKPIRLAWYGLVCPSLVLNYFGQGALILREPSAVSNPFYLLAPDSFLIALVILATMATVIASQATISGAYSLTFQAIRLGYLPRMRIQHTSDTAQGQIYIPSINWIMLLGVIWLVLELGSSSNLAAAYGIAVSGTMVITSVLVLIVAIARSNQRLRHVIIPLVLVCLGFELVFFAANMTKFVHGGWIPLVTGILIFILLSTWKTGSELLGEQRRKINMTLRKFVNEVLPTTPRIPGTAIYLSSSAGLVPSRLFYNLKHYKVLHEQLIFLHVNNEEIPYVAGEERLQVLGLASGLYTIAIRFGFREEPDLSKALQQAALYQLNIPSDASFFIARTSVVSCEGILPYWRCRLFAWMMRQSESAATYFRIAPNQVVELGTQVSL
ncbi:MAG: potassium transporter Kup [Thiothrix sp.]|nr:MAG: potassium transporter Kup [Thiothrix sp.]